MYIYGPTPQPICLREKRITLSASPICSTLVLRSRQLFAPLPYILQLDLELPAKCMQYRPCKHDDQRIQGQKTKSQESEEYIRQNQWHPTSASSTADSSTKQTTAHSRRSCLSSIAAQDAAIPAGGPGLCGPVPLRLAALVALLAKQHTLR
jgi:hypothetical protein